MISPELHCAVLAVDAGRCFYCGYRAIAVACVEPLADGGTDGPENLVSVCRRCQGAGAQVSPVLRLEAQVTAFARVHLVEELVAAIRESEQRAKGRRASPARRQ